MFAFIARGQPKWECNAYRWPGASLRGREALKAGVSIFKLDLLQVVNSTIKVQAPTMKAVANTLKIY